MKMNIITQLFVKSTLILAIGFSQSTYGSSTLASSASGTAAGAAASAAEQKEAEEFANAVAPFEQKRNQPPTRITVGGTSYNLGRPSRRSSTRSYWQGQEGDQTSTHITLGVSTGNTLDFHFTDPVQGEEHHYIYDYQTGQTRFDRTVRGRNERHQKDQKAVQTRDWRRGPVQKSATGTGGATTPATAANAAAAAASASAAAAPPAAATSSGTS